jgi:hypothetical protein
LRTKVVQDPIRRVFVEGRIGRLVRGRTRVPCQLIYRAKLPECLADGAVRDRRVLPGSLLAALGAVEHPLAPAAVLERAIVSQSFQAFRRCTAFGKIQACVLA